MDLHAQISSGEYSLEGTTVIKTVEMHTGGEPTRIVVQGYPRLHGETLLEKRAYAREHLDHMRQCLIREPRGHNDMYGAIIVPETEKTHSGEADVGVLFCHNEGYSTMCGHATIALGRCLVDTEDLSVFPRRKQVPFDEGRGESRIRLHAPCGVVDVTVPSVREGDRVRSDPGRDVQFVSVRSFAAATDVVVEVPEGLRWPELRVAGRSAVKVDVAYGGAFYVIVQEKELGFERVREGGVNTRRLDEATRVVKQLVGAQKGLFRGHGLAEDLAYLYGVIVVDDGENQAGLGGEGEGRLGVCFYAEQALDRSPTGSGVSARVALARAKGLLGAGERVRFDSLLSARPGGEAGAFTGSSDAAESVRVAGRAFYTGACAVRGGGSGPLFTRRVRALSGDVLRGKRTMMSWSTPTYTPPGGVAPHPRPFSIAISSRPLSDPSSAMSYASVAAHNAPPSSEQVTLSPDYPRPGKVLTSSTSPIPTPRSSPPSPPARTTSLMMQRRSTSLLPTSRSTPQRRRLSRTSPPTRPPRPPRPPASVVATSTR
ncbi:hypothetical protein C8T65DRAFT_242379 [Cerioporus squamosus]|nr:hypothetical protein C8T65DRAFT_242379 [Cerioporus squamosus]